jgi:hypothetical protein
MARHTRRRSRQQARELKREPASLDAVGDEDDGAPCDECGRSEIHAEWCLAEADL